MYKKIADQISASLVSSGTICRSETKIYSYAAELLLSSITGLAICVGIGMVFGDIIGSIIFLTVYCPLRQLSGGYHAANHISCAVIFCLVFLVNTIVAQYIIATLNFLPAAIIIVAGISVVTINFLSPVEDRNKPLSQGEKGKFKKKAMMFSIIAFFLIVMLVRVKLMEASYYACSAVLILSMLLVMGKIKNRKGEENEKEILEISSANGCITNDTCNGIGQ